MLIYTRAFIDKHSSKIVTKQYLKKGPSNFRRLSEWLVIDVSLSSHITGRTVTLTMSLKRIRRRLSQTFTRFHDGSLTELAEHLTIEENGGIRENG